MSDFTSVRGFITSTETHAFSATGIPLAQKLASVANYINDMIFPTTAFGTPDGRRWIGEVMWSFLDESDFQAVMGTNWVLMDGRDVSGSEWATLWSLTNIPDARGRYIVGASNVSTVYNIGIVTTGDIIADANFLHFHPLTITKNLAVQYSGSNDNAGLPGTVDGSYTTTFNGGWSLGAATGKAGAEFCAKAVVVNYYIKINSVTY